MQNTCIKTSTVLDCPRVLLAAYHSPEGNVDHLIGEVREERDILCWNVICCAEAASVCYTPVKHLRHACADASFCLGTRSSSRKSYCCHVRNQVGLGCVLLLNMCLRIMIAKSCKVSATHASFP